MIAYLKRLYRTWLTYTTLPIPGKLEKIVEEEKPRPPRYVCECDNGNKFYAEHEEFLKMPYHLQRRYKKIEEGQYAERPRRNDR
jgi:hypothetical protein